MRISLFHLKQPRIALCGLNPHAGENGLLGKEEQEILIPAINAAQKNAVNVTGPYPADTVFWKARNNHFDGVIALYHDQGAIPVKVLDFDHGVNMTLGIPFIRTSPDHGTAFDIAWQNKANPKSMITATKMALSILFSRLQKIE